MTKELLRIAAVLLVLGGFAPARAAAPAATTSAATTITNASAVLNGSGTPAGEPTSGWFRYAATSPGSCNDSFGTRLPATGGTDLGAGNVAVAYSITAAGLAPGTTYYFCAIVSNASGTALGAVLSFTVPSAPLVTTAAATAVGSRSVTLRGSANPVGASTSGWFRYGTVNPGACDDTFGTRAPSTGGSALGAGAAAVAYSQGVTGLLPGTVYYFCALASNTLGTGTGTVESFTTLPEAPTVSTSSTTALAGTSVTLNGSANPNGDGTTGWFRYDTSDPGSCNDSFGTRSPASGGSSLGGGNSNASFSRSLADLTPGVTYYYCAVASNSVGTSFGTVRSFTTPLPPIATSLAATSITGTSAQLNGSGLANGASSTAWFRYAATDPGTCNDTFGSRAPLAGGTSLGSGTNTVSFSQTISGLSSGATYYYCAIVSSAEGTAFGAVLTLRTQATPSASTEPATGVTATSATLRGSANPSGASTTGWFRYSTTSPGTCSDGFGTRVPSTGAAALGSGHSVVNFSQGIAGLTPGTTYYYCAIANNSLGTAFGAVASFTTEVAPPEVSTLTPSPLGGTTATLRALVNPGGAATTGWFRYALVSPGTCNDSFGMRPPAGGGSAIPAGTVNTSYEQAISGLVPGTRYYACAIASNSAGTTLGSPVSFTTPLPPVATTAAATSVTASTARLNGSGLPNGSETVGWFRYAATEPEACNDTFGSRAPASGGSSLGSGTSTSSFSQTVGGLSAGTTYYFCAVASSAEGTSFGEVRTLRTQGPPSASTTAASSITASSATLRGSANPNGGSTTGWFRYSTTSPGTCNDSFGTRVPSSDWASASLGSGTGFVDYAEGASGLLPGTTYYYCAIANNSLGTAYGAVASFTTLVAAPELTPLSPSPLGGTSATLGALVNPGGAATTGWFRYAPVSPGTCNDTFGVRAPAAGGSAIPAGTSGTSYGQAVSGLVPGTTYYFCAIASNAAGTTLSGLASFTTPLPPAATTVAATSVTASTARLNGSGVPNGSATVGWFRYSATAPETCDDTFGSRAPTSGGTSLGSGTSAVSFSQTVSGLSQGTTYYYCAITSSAEGTSFGTVLALRTQGPPSAATDAASSITSSSATLHGSANPNGAGSTGWFRYATTSPGTCNDSFGTRVPSTDWASTSLGSGTSAVAFAQAVSELLPGTTYYYCAIANNSLGTAYGAVTSFTTQVAAPKLSALTPSPLGGTTATLRASVNPGGAATTGWFRYALTSPGTCNDSFGVRAPASGGVPVPAGTSTTSYVQAISGLVPGTTYYACAIASNSAGAAVGSVISFTTPLPPTATTSAATYVTSSEARLNGSGVPNGSATAGWFRYSATEPEACDDTFGSRAPTSGGTSIGSGTSPSSFSSDINGLSAGTTYYYCAIASSAEGTSFGAIRTLRTQGPPSASTAAASSIASSSATLRGAANPNGGTSTGWFRFATTSPGTCNDSFGTRLPSQNGTSLGSGTGFVDFTQLASGLLPGTTYYYCAIANNSLGTAYGAVASFTTEVAAPGLVPWTPSPLGGTTATLRASVNPGGAATTGWFRYAPVSPGTCNDTFGVRAPASGGSEIPADAGITSYQQAISGLVPGTTYYFCAIASNAGGTTTSGLASFKTPLPPAATTMAATYVTSSEARLNGSGVPNGASAQGWFRYAATDPGTCDDTFGSRAPTSGGTSLGSGSSGAAFSQSIGNLTPGATYYYCAIVASAEGTSFGAVLTLRTQGPPSASTAAASSITSSSATLNGSANPNGAASTGWFRYATTSPGSCNDSFGTRVPSTDGAFLGSGTEAVAFAYGITGLAPATTYYFCAIASNAQGTALGPVLSFTTDQAAPTVTTGSPSSLTSTSAQLRASVLTGGAATTGWFRLATVSPGTCNDSFGTRVPATGGVSLGSGPGTVDLSEAVTGLTSGATYYVCALASNAVGSSVGAVVSFVVPLQPTVASLAATPVTATTATLNGSANPNGRSATGWFRFSTTNPGACTDEFGTRVPATGGTNLGSGSLPVAFAQPIAGLTPGTLYYSCAIASTSVGTVFGEVLTFTTPPTQPTVVTVAASGIVLDSAVLNATVNPGGGAATGWFRYSTMSPGTCNDSFGTRAPASGGAEIPAGTTSVSYAATLAELSPGTTYYFCAIASNGVGTAFGSVLSFNTAVPTVATGAATAVSSTGATLNGSATPNGTATTGWFRYSSTDPGACNDAFGTRLPGAGGTSLGSGSSPVPYSQPIGGLTPATTYYFCALASNAVGTSFGAVRSFTTPGAPTVVTQAASGLVGSGATLNGAAAPNGDTATGWFRYAATSPGSCHDGFGTRVPESGGTALGAGTAPVPFSESIAGLVPGSTYFACAFAANSFGTAAGAPVAFTVPSMAPVVSTVSATPLTSTTARLDGAANPSGAATSGWFRYDTVDPGTCNDDFGTRVPTTGGTALGSGNGPVAFTRSLLGLEPGTTYHYCAVAANATGTSFGPVLSFTMPSPPVAVTLAATAVGDTTATLNGAANPNGSATLGWFRYATSNPGSCSDTFGTRLPATGGTALGSGGTSMGFSQAATGLAPDTVYYFCAIASNATGLSTGTVFSFRTPTRPAVVTHPAAAVTSTGATLQGSASPNGAATTAWFRYATTNPGTCSDTFGTRAPAVGGATLGSGTSPVDFSLPVTGLAPGTVYYVCALASNAIDTSTGAPESFATPAAAPFVATLAPTDFASGSVTLQGSASANGDPGLGWFRFATADPGACDDAFGTRVPASGGAALGSSSDAVSFTQPVTGLLPGTTYYVCALASNSLGTTPGAVRSFTMPALPSVSTTAAGSIADTSAALHGEADPHGTATLGWFRYDTSHPGSCNDGFGTRLPATGGAALGAGTAAVAFTELATGLLPDTLYYYCALATNAAGTAAGTIGSFRTSAAPAVVTAAATLVASGSATLNGTANPKGESATGWFRFSTTNPVTCDDAFGTRAPASGGVALGAGTSALGYSLPVSELLPGTTYYYCAIAGNALGTTAGSVRSFTTSATAPTVETTGTGFLTGSTVTLGGAANPGGTATHGWFRYASIDPGTCNDTFGTRAPATGGAALGAGTASVSYAQAIAGLQPGTTYFFCALAGNAQGSAIGAVRSFTTPAAPAVTTAAAASITDREATLHGSADPAGTATTAWFRYATSDPGTCHDGFGTRAPAADGAALGAGAAPVAFSQPLAGLLPDTTYFFCALASNAGGVSTGTVRSFRTSSAPAVATAAATLVASRSATLNGTANPKGESATGWFRYAATSPGACDDTFGTRVPAEGGSALGSGTSPVSFAQVLSGLTPGTTYYACAIATNPWGTTFGTVVSFRTAAVAPAVTTSPAALLSGASVQLAGLAVPNGEAATGWFRYGTLDPGTCSDTFGTRAPATGGTTLGAGTATVSFAETVTGLAPGTTYYYCAVASSAAGTSVGAVLSFATPALPSVSTLAATAVTDSAATLQGAAAAHGSAGTAWFRYAANAPGACDDVFGTRVPAVGGTSIGAGSTPVDFSQALHGLAPGTTYYFCAIASNSAGVATGPVLTFRTPTAPSVATDAATLVTTSTARLNGSAIPNGASSGGWFRYDTVDPGTCDDAFGTRVPLAAVAALGSGTAPASFAQTVSGLQPGTTYFHCALASNAYGTATGAVLSFRTPAIAPETTTESAVLLAGTDVQLRGSANPHGAAASGWFRYGTVHPGACSEGFGTRAPASGGTALGGGNGAVAFAETLTGLAPGTTYFYCAVAGNAEGTTFGTVQSFETAPLPLATTLPATLVGLDSATLQGSGTPNGNAATGWFRYATSNPGSCDDEFGTRVPATGSVQLGTGTSAVAFSQTVAALSPGTTYFTCAIVANAGGTAFGDVLAFTTEIPVAPPEVTSEPATELTSATATLHGIANPNHGETTGWFRLSPTAPSTCSDAFGTRVPLEGETLLGSGDEPVAFSEAVAGLVPGTTYHYCAIAANPAGTRFGAVRSFTTEAAAPDVTTLPATEVERGEATLHGTAVANGAATSAWFRYSSTEPEGCDDTFGTRSPAQELELGDGTGPVAFSERISGLAHGERTYYCAIASNARGLSFGEVLSVVPGDSAPDVTTEEAVEVGETAATLAGAVNPMGNETLAWFRFGEESAEACSDAFGRRVPASGGVTVPAGESTVTFAEEVDGLEPATTYYYCAAATNSGGASFGELRSFRTRPVPPLARTTGLASGADGPILQAMVDPRGSETSVWFRYGPNKPEACDDDFGERTATADDTNVGAGRSMVAVAQSVDWGEGLHYFCVVAANEAGTAYGEVLSSAGPASSGESEATGCACGTARAEPALWLLPILGLLVRRRRRSARS